MTEQQKKIELLQRIVHRLNEAHVQWALGASMLLYFKGITSAFHDIDLMVADHDAECVRGILLEMGELRPSDPGFAIVHEGTVYDCSLREEQIVEKMPLGTEVIPLQSPQLWCKYYRLMGRPQKADMIEKALSCGIPSQQSSQNNMG